jgi:ribosomal-protein-alanine N-acetyltransferase
MGLTLEEEVHVAFEFCRASPVFRSVVGTNNGIGSQGIVIDGTEAQKQKYLARLASECHYGLLVVRREDKLLAGVINLNNVVRGSFQSAALGYYAFSPFERQGHMEEGMLLVIRLAFTQLKLHRLEANVQPDNRASIALLRKCGFVREGFSRRFLKVGGHWRDHERWAILKDG